MTTTTEKATVEIKPWLQLTAKQRRVVEAMCWLHYQSDHPPTLREIIVELGINSPNGLMYHLLLLRRYGYVQNREKATSHNWVVAVAPPDWVLLPGGGIVPREDLAELVGQLQRELLAS